MSSIINRLRGNQTQTLGTPIIATPAYGTSYVTEDQLSLQQQQFTLQKSGTIINEPATTTTLQPIVQQSIRQDRVVEVQPIIHRDIERPVVNHIERHITEPAPVSRAGAIQHGAIVEERVHNRVVNEIQPVIHREIAVPQVEQVQQHFVERVVATPQHTRQVVYEQIPAVQGQQYIQQGLGTQQYLQSGLVQRSALIATQQPGFLGQQGGIPLAYNQQQSLLTQQPIVGQQALLAQQPYSTGFVQRGLVSEPLVGQQFVGQPIYGTGYGSVYGQNQYGLTKAEQKQEKQFERNLNRQIKHIEREQNQINRHQLRQYEQLQNQQNLLERHQLFQAQHQAGLVGSPLLAQPGFGSRSIYSADPIYGQQFVGQPIYGTGLAGQQFINQPYGTGIIGQQQFYGQPGLNGQQAFNPLDRNHDGRVDINDLTGRPGYGQQGLNQQGFNPLDRNHDGRVDVNDLTGRPGVNQQGFNPADKNHDGRVDANEQFQARAEQAALNREIQAHGQQF